MEAHKKGERYKIGILLWRYKLFEITFLKTFVSTKTFHDLIWNISVRFVKSLNISHLENFGDSWRENYASWKVDHENQCLKWLFWKLLFPLWSCTIKSDGTIFQTLMNKLKTTIFSSNSSCSTDTNWQDAPSQSWENFLSRGASFHSRTIYLGFGEFGASVYQTNMHDKEYHKTLILWSRVFPHTFLRLIYLLNFLHLWKSIMWTEHILLNIARTVLWTILFCKRIYTWLLDEKPINYKISDV